MKKIYNINIKNKMIDEILFPLYSYFLNSERKLKTKKKKIH